MSDEIKDFETTPALTFEATPEEQQMMETYSAQIDLHDSQAILEYGVGTQKKMADFSENALKSVRTKDLEKWKRCSPAL